MSSPWQWDDESIQSDGVIYRHIPANDPTCFLTGNDGITVQLAPKVFKKNDFPDGWSVFRDELMQALGLDISAIENSAKDPEANPRNALRATVSDIRYAGLGIHDKPDESLGALGDAHAVLRFPHENPTKEDIRLAREHLSRCFKLA